MDSNTKHTVLESKDESSDSATDSEQNDMLKSTTVSNHQHAQNDVEDTDIKQIVRELSTQFAGFIDNATNSEFERTESISTKAATNTEKTEQQKIQKIFEELGGPDSFLNSGEGVDICQLVAFQSECKPEGKTINIALCNRSFEIGYNIYYYNIFKALVTFFVQIASVFVLLDYALTTIKQESDKDFCDNSGDAGPKTMAVSYTTFLSLILWSTVQQGRNSGFYTGCIGSEEWDNPIFKIVDYTWLTFGRTLCHGVILSAFSLSFLIIFYTTDPMDIILNAVALLFIADIDNRVVTPNDYEDMYKWFKDSKNLNHFCCKKVRFSLGRSVKIAVNVFAFCMAVTAPLLIIICY